MYSQHICQNFYLSLTYLKLYLTAFNYLYTFHTDLNYHQLKDTFPSYTKCIHDSSYRLYQIHTNNSHPHILYVLKFVAYLYTSLV